MGFRFKGNKPRTMSFISLWDNVLTAMLQKNKSKYGVVRNKDVYVDMVGLYSGEDNVTYIYSIDGYPKEIEISYRSTLREQCKAGVRLSFISTLESHTIDWNSNQMKAKLRVWKLLDEETPEVDEYNLYNNLSKLDGQDWKKDSLKYLADAEIRRKRKMFKFRSIMLISGKRGDDFDNSVKDIVGLCKHMDIKLSRVIGDIPQYLQTFSPFSNSFDMKVLKQCGCITIPDEMLARFNTYAQGTVGVRGQYWGTDIFSCFPCLKPTKKTTETAENWLFTAETGGGKSYFVKSIILQLLALDMYIGTVMDVEGFEYVPIHDYISISDNSIVLNMGEGSGTYYDPVEISLTGIPLLDKDMYALSSSFTLSLFKCLLGASAEEDEWVDIVITDAVALTYGKAGVDPNNPETWSNSKGLTIYSVYEILKSLRVHGDADRAISAVFNQSLYNERLGIDTKMSSNDVNRLVASNEGYQKAIDLCIAKTSRFFEPNGIMATVFRNRVVLSDIKDAKLVVCSFGMAGKSPETVDPIKMSLMQLYAANISHLRSIFGKATGRFNFKVWEEFQRWGGFPDADKTINVALTGGRKLGDINIILTNKVSDMLDNDKFGVFGNITSFAVGCIADADVRERLCKRLSIEEMLPDLDCIASNSVDLDSFIDGDEDLLLSNAYTKAFLIGLDRAIYTVSKVVLPKELSNSAMFRTGVDKKQQASN